MTPWRTTSTVSAPVSDSTLVMCLAHTVGRSAITSRPSSGTTGLPRTVSSLALYSSCATSRWNSMTGIARDLARLSAAESLLSCIVNFVLQSNRKRQEKAKDRRARRADQRAAVDTIAGRNFVWTAGNTHGLPPFRPEGLSAAQLVPHLFRPEVLGRFPAEVGNEQQRLEAHWRTYDEPTVGQLMALPFLPHQTHARTITPPEAPMHIDDMVFFGIGLYHKRRCLCSMCILLRRERRLL